MNQKAIIPIGSIENYITWAYQIPILSLEEERSLAERWRAHGDLDAARRLVLSHLRFVVSLSRGYLGYGLPQADLIQEGAIGLMKAVKRFDPTKGVRLVSFAVHWIKAEMHEFILRNWRVVKIATTKAQRKLFFNLRRTPKKLMWFTEAEIQMVAHELNVPIKEVRQMEMRMMGGPDDAFDPAGAANEDESEAYLSPAQYLTTDQDDPALLTETTDWTRHRHTQLVTALAKLDPRSQDIVKERWLSDKKTTLSVLAKKHGISLERIRQLENAAMAQLKALLSSAA